MSKVVKIEAVGKLLLIPTKQTLKLVKKTFLSPKKAIKMGFLLKFLTEKVVTHLKIFLEVIKFVWQGVL